MNDNNVIILFESEKRDSWSDYGVKIFTQYAIVPIPEEEKQKLYDQYRIQSVFTHNPYKSIKRHCKILQSNEIVFGDWDLMDITESKNKACFSFGDSYFLNGNGKSLHPLYDATIEIIKKRNLLHKELEKLEDLITPNKFERLSPINREYRDKFDQALKDNRLYSKAQKNQVNPDVLESIKKPLQDKYKKEMKNIHTRIEEIKNELSDLDLS